MSGEDSIAQGRERLSSGGRDRGHSITKTQPVITFDAEISDRDVCPSYARITDCRLARLFLLETHERAPSRISRAFAFTHESGFPVRFVPLGDERGEGSPLFDFHEFLMYRYGIRSKKWFQENALRYYAKRREEISLERFSVDKRFSL